MQIAGWISVFPTFMSNISPAKNENMFTGLYLPRRNQEMNDRWWKFFFFSFFFEKWAFLTEIYRMDQSYEMEMT
jgi:hypothetical protein